MRHVDTVQSQCLFAAKRCDISPPPGIYHRMWGAASHDQAAGQHRPLTATVTVFKEYSGGRGDAERQVVILLDHCLLGPPEIARLKDHILPAARLAPTELLFLFSHTHAAGLMTLDRSEMPGGDLIPSYLDHVGNSIATLVRSAMADAEPASIVYGSGKCDLARNRDYWDEQLQQFVCGFNPQATADDTVTVARVTAQNDDVLATFVNYACHPTTLAWDNRLVSPDYPGAMRELIESEMGGLCIFVQGASGDLGPRHGFVGDPGVADQNGRQLGYAALAALTALPPPASTYCYSGPVVSGATIGTWRYDSLPRDRLRAVRDWRVQRSTVLLRYRPELPELDRVLEQLEHYTQLENEAVGENDAATAQQCRAHAERQRRLANRLRVLPPGEHFPLEVFLWKIGDVVWIAVQGEPYSDLQVQLRRRWPGRALMIAGVANGWGPSYLPRHASYGTGVYQESVAVVEAGSLEHLIEELGTMIEHLESPRPDG